MCICCVGWLNDYYDCVAMSDDVKDRSRSRNGWLPLNKLNLTTQAMAPSPSVLWNQ